MKKQLVIIHGVSGTGKTSLGLALENMNTLYRHVHPIGFLKKFIENIYGLRINSLEDYETKYNQVDPSKPSTFQDILMEMWTGFQKHDPSFSTKGWRKDLERAWNMGEIPVTLSLRNLEEVDYLNQVLTDSDNVLVIFLERPTSEGFFTDAHHKEIAERLKTIPGKVQFRRVVNDSETVEDWVTNGLEVVESWRNSLRYAPVQ